MDFKEVFQKEHVTRKFTNRKVPENAIAEIIKKAQQSPSLLNSQPWRAYVLVGDPLEKLKIMIMILSQMKILLQCCHLIGMFSQVETWLLWVHLKVFSLETSCNYFHMLTKQCLMPQLLFS